MRSLYVRPGCARSVGGTRRRFGRVPCWLSYRVLAEDLSLDRRANAEAILVDLLEPVAMDTIEVRTPAGDRAAKVAARIGAEPADDKKMRWGAG